MNQEILESIKRIMIQQKEELYKTNNFQLGKDFDLVEKWIKDQEIKNRLEYLRGEIQNGSISYGEIAELQDLAEHIDPADVELLEWAGVPEFPEDETFCHLCGSVESNHWCTNESCSEFTRYAKK